MQSHETRRDPGSRFEFGHDILGPIVADYLSRLYTHITAFESSNGARTLFVSRAGVRIRRALDVFIGAVGLPAPASAEYFWISRLMVAKGVWNRTPAAAEKLLAREFGNATISDFIRAMFRFEQEGGNGPADDPALAVAGNRLGVFLAGDTPDAARVRRFFSDQASLFESYLSGLMAGHRTALLIDTGWQGTSQTLLADAFPEYEWWGAYFGRFGMPDSDRSRWDQILGLVFESDVFVPEHPETCTVLNRHLVESLFEPAGRSIERLAIDADGRIVAPDAGSVLADDPSPGTDPLFSGVLSFLKALPRGHHPAALRRNAALAWQGLAHMTVHPTPQQARLLQQIRRSADFGREITVPLLLPVANRHDEDTANRRINDSLWPCGQVALEYPEEVARPLQRQIAGGRSPAVKAPSEHVAVASVARSRPAVAVITRTMDRPMFLRRALASVAAQEFRDYVHVVINDGGDNEQIRAAILGSNCDHSKVLLVDAVQNRGMEAASNLAISLSASDYVVIHDDDDSWEPEFLSATVAFLGSVAGRKYGGVITRSTYVSEEVTPAGIEEHRRSSYQGWVENVHLLEMSISNFFPPIAFVYRRELWEKLKGYNESYPVLGDWDFNLRFLLEADIGVIPRFLANYHHRDRGDTITFGNSVIAGRNKHLEYAAIVRNNFIRHLATQGNSAAATLIGMGLYLEEQRHRIRLTDQRLTQWEQSSTRGQESPLLSGSGRSPDDYWVAFQRLFTAVHEQDASILGKVPRSRGDADDAVDADSEDSAAVPVDRQAMQAAAATLMQAAILQVMDGKSGSLVPPDFDEALYLRQNPDVEAALRRGSISSAYEHFYRYGRTEGRIRPTRK